MVSLRGSVPERQKKADCKSAGTAYEGSNPSRPTFPVIFWEATRTEGTLARAAAFVTMRLRICLTRLVPCLEDGLHHGCGHRQGSAQGRGEVRDDGSNGKDRRIR